MENMKLEFKFTVENIIIQKRTTKENIDVIKTWLPNIKEKYIPPELPDELIVLFLLSCDNNIELTKKTIISHYKLKQAAPEIFDGRSMDRTDIQKAFNTVRLASIPVRTDDNIQIIYVSLKDTNYRNLDLIPCMKASYMLLDIEHDINPPDGIMYLVDMQGFGFMHVTRLRPDPIKKYLAYLGEGLPIQFKGMHFLNSNYFLEKLLGIVKLFLRADFFKKLYMHQPGLPVEEVCKLIPKKCLPKELQGDLGSQDDLCAKTIQLLNGKETFWNKEEQLRKQL